VFHVRSVEFVIMRTTKYIVDVRCIRSPRWICQYVITTRIYALPRNE